MCVGQVTIHELLHASDWFYVVHGYCIRGWLGYAADYNNNYGV